MIELKNSKDKQGGVSLRLLLVIALGLIPLVLLADPGWWTTSTPPVISGTTKNDYAAVNQGQVKNIATAAVAEFNAHLPGGAGQTLNDLVAAWAAPLSERKDYSAVNVGQLKALAKPFYDRLIEVGYTSAYPWSASANPPNDYAMANIGQVKNLFSFDLMSTDLEHDTDQNGLPDWWEESYFGQTGIDPEGLADRGDGLTNLEAFQRGYSPLDFYDGRPPVLVIVSGNNQGDFPNTTLANPLVVRVTNANGLIPPNATIAFAISSGSGVLTPLNEGAAGNNGLAKCFLQLPGIVGMVIRITATAEIQGRTAQVIFTASVGDATQAPDAPSDVHCTRKSPTEVLVEWTDNSNNETAFYVERSLDNATWTQIATLPANITSYVDAAAPLADDPTLYRIVAYNEAP